MKNIKIEKPTKEQLDKLNIKSWSPWSCEPTTFDWEYSEDETAYVFEGKVIVTTDAGDKVAINKGDLVHFPKGMKCSWHVLETIRKVYTFK